RALGERVSLDELLYLLRAFLEADAQMRESPHPRVELEIAAVRAARRPVPAAIEEIVRKVDEAEARLRKAAISMQPAPKPVQEDLLSAVGRRAVERPAGVGMSPGPAMERPAGAAPPRGAPAVDLAAGWARVVDEVTRTKAMLGAVVNQATPLDLSDGQLTVRLQGNH